MKKLSAILLCTIMISPLAMASSGEIEALKQQLKARDVAILDMQNTISQQEQIIRTLQGRMDDLEIQMKTLYGNQQTIYTELENAKKTASTATTNVGDDNKAITSNTNNVVTPTPTPASNDKAVKKADSSEKELYDASYKKLTNNEFAEAKKGFEEIIAKYPNSELTPNAYYWLGQILYKEKNYVNAKSNFLNVTKFKDSQKRADSIYKLGLISVAQNDKEKAKKFFTLVVEQYPNDTSAILAKKELSKL